MATIERITQYKVKSSDTFFFDNNIWMFLFPPISNTHTSRQQIYGNLLKDIRTANATIFINSLVVSEYINRRLRLSHSIWQRKELEKGNRMVDYKKDFCNTSEYASAKQDAASEILDILSIAYKKPDDFNAIDINTVINSEDMDFNDAYYAYYSEKNNLILVSDDNDFLSSKNNITVLTV